MARALERPRRTLADYTALGPDVRAELIGGELYVTPSPMRSHQRLVLRLGAALDAHVRACGSGEILVAPFDVYLPSGDVVQPDLLYMRAGREAMREDGVHGVPDLVVEVVSRTHPEPDRAVKRALYERNGVPAYWIADPDERSLEAVEHDGRAFRPAFFAVGPTTVEPRAFPGLVLDLGAVFEERAY